MSLFKFINNKYLNKISTTAVSISRIHRHHIWHGRIKYLRNRFKVLFEFNTLILTFITPVMRTRIRSYKIVSKQRIKLEESRDEINYARMKCNARIVKFVFSVINNATSTRTHLSALMFISSVRIPE